MEQKKAVKSYVIVFSAVIVLMLGGIFFFGSGARPQTLNSLYYGLAVSGVSVFGTFLILLITLKKPGFVFFYIFSIGMLARFVVFGAAVFAAYKISSLDFTAALISIACFYFIFLAAEAVFYRMV